MIHAVKTIIIGVVFTGLLSGVHAQTFIAFQNNALGVSMRLPETYYNLIPKSMRSPTSGIQSMGQGWTGIRSSSRGEVGIIAAKKDTLVSDPQHLLPSLITITGIPASFWQMDGDTVNVRGWTKFKAYHATGDKGIAFAVIGTGTAKSYIVCLSTTISAVQGNTAIQTWFNSVTLLPPAQPATPTQTAPPVTQPAKPQTAPTATPSTTQPAAQPASQPTSTTMPKPQPDNQKAKYK